MLELNTRPKSKPVFDLIRSHILEGRFHPGQWLKQADLESAYDASRSEIRAALTTLSERGIVEHAVNQGFRVSDRSHEEIQEMVEIIVTLERFNADSVVANATKANIAELEKLAEEFSTLIENGRHAELRLANYNFHSYLNGLGSNKTLAYTAQRMRECCIIGPFGRYTTYKGLQESNAEHFRIIDFLKKKDVEGFRVLLTEHSSHID